MAKEKRTPEEVVALLAKALTPQKEKKAAKKDRILVVDGEVCTDMYSLKEAKKIAKRFSTKDVKIDIYKKEGTLTVTLPVEVV